MRGRLSLSRTTAHPVTFQSKTPRAENLSTSHDGTDQADCWSGLRRTNSPLILFSSILHLNEELVQSTSCHCGHAHHLQTGFNRLTDSAGSTEHARHQYWDIHSRYTDSVFKQLHHNFHQSIFSDTEELASYFLSEVFWGRGLTYDCNFILWF